MLPRVFPPHFMKEWDHGETRDVEQVIGAFFFARRDLYLRLNGFDERFFVYYEEVDYCMRARQLGFRTVFLSTAQADHAGGGCSNQIRGRSLFYSLRSRILYANKHFRSGEALAVAFATFVLEPVIRISTMIAGLRLKNVSPLCYGFSLLWWDRLISLISTATKARSTLDEASGTAQQVPTMTTETQKQTRSAA